MSKTYYKLTDMNGATRNNTQWKIGETKTLPTKKNPELCSGDVFHAYTNLNLGLLLNPIHANIENPRVWEITGKVCVSDWGKAGMFSQKPVREIEVPQWYRNETTRNDVRVTFAILCAEAVLDIYESEYPNDDRPRKAIDAAKECLRTKYAARAAAVAAADAAAHAAAVAAAYAARAADAAAFAADAARAADAAAFAADAAAHAAARAAATIDFGKLADKAVKTVLQQ